MMLSMEDLKELRVQLQHRRNFSLDEFVSVMHHLLQHQVENEPYEFTSTAIDLFHTIDIHSSGTLNWSDVSE